MDGPDGEGRPAGASQQPLRCAVCNTGLAPDALDQPGRVCDHCGATRQSIELTEALLATIGRGIEPFLYRMAFEAPTRSARVLDLSGDRALSHVLWVVDGYRTGPAPRGGMAADDLLAEPPGSIDLLILRNRLFAADDLAATLDAIARILAPGGWAIMQERIPWPVPDETVTLPALKATMRPVGGGVSLPERHVIGADIVDMLAARGMVGEVYRPNLGLDPLFRSAVLTGLRV